MSLYVSCARNTKLPKKSEQRKVLIGFVQNEHLGIWRKTGRKGGREKGGREAHTSNHEDPTWSTSNEDEEKDKDEKLLRRNINRMYVAFGGEEDQE